MILDLNKVKEIINNRDLTAYYIAKEIGSNRQNLHHYKEGKYSIQNMRIEMALRIQDLYNKLEADNMYKLIAIEEGEVQSKAYFNNFENLKQHLITTDYFSWINDAEQTANVELSELPDFTNVEDVRDLEIIFDEYDYSWWTMTVEVDEQEN